MSIPLVTLPDAGAVDYGSGDIDYYAESDPVAAGADQLGPDNRPMRNLAYRDNVLADTINDMIEKFGGDLLSSYYITARDPIALTVLVDAGRSVKSDGSGAVELGVQTTSPAFTAVATLGNARFDLLTIDDTGALIIVAGPGEVAEGSDPLTNCSAFPTDKLVIGIIQVAGRATPGILQTDITDMREFLNKGGGSGDATSLMGTPMFGTASAGEDGYVWKYIHSATRFELRPDATGGGTIVVEDDGSVIVAATSTVNFTGDGVVVTDAGGGQADVAIPGGVAAWHLFNAMTIGQTVLNIPFSYTPGTHSLYAVRNGAEMIVDEPGAAGFAETSTTSITLNTPIANTNERIVVYKVLAVTGSLNHDMAFHDDGAEILASCQSYRNLAIECNNNTQVVIKSGTNVLVDDWVNAIALSGDITVDITSSGLNGLDTGSEAIDTWYYIYAIKNPISVVIGGLLSTSPTAPTLPAGFTQKRLIGAVRNDGSGNFIQFIQRGCKVTYLAWRTLLSGGTSLSFVPLALGNIIPTTIAPSFDARWYLSTSSFNGGTHIEPSVDGVVLHTQVTCGAATIGTSAFASNDISDLAFIGNQTWYRVSRAGWVGDIRIRAFNLSI